MYVLRAFATKDNPEAELEIVLQADDDGGITESRRAGIRQLWEGLWRDGTDYMDEEDRSIHVVSGDSDWKQALAQVWFRAGYGLKLEQQAPERAWDDSDEDWGNEDSMEVRSAASRTHLREAYRPALRAMASEIVEQQTAAIRAEVAGQLAHRTVSDLESWLEQYHHQTLAPAIREQALPVLAAYTAAVERAVLDELGIPMLNETLAPFLALYADDLANSYIGRSLGQLAQVIREAQEKQLDIKTAIEQRLTEWLATRADRLAEVESVRAGEAAAHHTYRRAGVRRLTWHELAGRKHCAYCNRLNGRTVAVEELFIPDGTELEGKKGEPKMLIRGNKRHPPAHRTCACYVTPER